MEQHKPIKTLVEALCECAELWCAAHRPEPAVMARLGRLAIADSGFFTRLPSQTKGTTTDTLERFAAFLLDPANWPVPENGAARVPQEARDLAHRCGISLSVADLATGQPGYLSGGAELDGVPA